MEKPIFGSVPETWTIQDLPILRRDPGLPHIINQDEIEPARCILLSLRMPERKSRPTR